MSFSKPLPGKPCWLPGGRWHCGVITCFQCSPGRPHHCGICGMTPSNHRSKDCHHRPRGKQSSTGGSVSMPQLHFLSISQSSCGVLGCTSCLPGQKHYCKFCKMCPSNHFSHQCSSQNSGTSQSSNCGVLHCKSCLPGQKHYCKFCKMCPSNHFSHQCPLQNSGTSNRPPSRPSSQRRNQLAPSAPMMSSSSSSSSSFPRRVDNVGIYLLFPYNGEFYVVVHIRGVNPGIGQVAAPGGNMDPNDRDAGDAAIREWNEETGGNNMVNKHTLQLFRVKTYNSGKKGAIFYQIVSSVPQLTGQSSTLFEMQNTTPPCHHVALGNRHFGIPVNVALKASWMFGVVQRTLQEMQQNGVF